MKLATFLFTLSVFTTPVLAFETEEIGTLEGKLGEEIISQPTVIATQDGKASPTAFFIVLGGGMSSLSLSGYQRDNSRLDISATFMAEAPGPETAPVIAEVSYSPNSGVYWVSEDAPTPVSIDFTTLDLNGNEGHAAGRFAGELCYSEDYGTTVDTSNCRPIEGSFDTKFFVE